MADAIDAYSILVAAPGPLYLPEATSAPTIAGYQVDTSADPEAAAAEARAHGAVLTETQIVRHVLLSCSADAPLWSEFMRGLDVMAVTDEQLAYPALKLRQLFARIAKAVAMLDKAIALQPPPASDN